jgi:hypothetical protein
MNTLQTIYNKLQDKTELAKHEVQLGIIQDILGLLGQGQDLNTSASSIVDNARIKYSESLKPLQQSKKLMDKVFVDAKALGIEIPKETLNIFKRVDSFIASSTNALAKINQL